MSTLLQSQNPSVTAAKRELFKRDIAIISGERAAHYFTHYYALEAIVKSNGSMDITVNKEKIVSGGWCLAWCEDCQDGINDNRDECDWWIYTHAKKRHSNR